MRWNSKRGWFMAPDDGGAGGTVAPNVVNEGGDVQTGSGLDVHFESPGDDNTDDIANQLMDEWSKPPEGTEAPADKPAVDDKAGVDGKAPEAEVTAPEADPATPPAPLALTDDALVTVGDKQVPFSVLRDALSRAAAVDERAQAITTETQKLAQATEFYTKQQEGVVKFWQDQWNELIAIDPRTAAQTMTNEQYTEYCKECDRVAQGLDAAQKQMSEAQAKHTQVSAKVDAEQAVACVKALQDPVTGIQGFDGNRYTAMRDYAIKNGIPAAAFDAERDPTSLKILDKAMRFDAGMASFAAVKAQPTIQSPKPANTGQAAGSTGNKGTDALAKFNKTGSLDDATAAILAEWK